MLQREKRDLNWYPREPFLQKNIADKVEFLSSAYFSIICLSLRAGSCWGASGWDQMQNSQGRQISWERHTSSGCRTKRAEKDSVRTNDLCKLLPRWYVGGVVTAALPSPLKGETRSHCYILYSYLCTSTLSKLMLSLLEGHVLVFVSNMNWDKEK